MVPKCGIKVQTPISLMPKVTLCDGDHQLLEADTADLEGVVLLTPKQPALHHFPAL